MGCSVKNSAVSACLFATFLLATSSPASDISGWCEDSESRESPVPNKEHVLLQMTQTMDAAASRKKNDIEIPRIKASSVPLNDEGYKMIATLKNDREMSEFIKRVANELGFEISEEAKLNGVVPYYSGKKATQSFAALTSEMGETSKRLKGWARKQGLAMKHADQSARSGQILLQTGQSVTHSKAVTSKMNSSAELPMKAAEVPLNELGYKKIAKLNSEREMLYFVKRVAEENGYQIADIGSLHGVVPYYSGKKATQSFIALQDELARTSKQPKGWARKAGQQKVSTHLLEVQLDKEKTNTKTQDNKQSWRQDEDEEEEKDDRGDNYAKRKDASKEKIKVKNNAFANKNQKGKELENTGSKKHSDSKRKVELASVHRRKGNQDKSSSRKTAAQHEMHKVHDDKHHSKQPRVTAAVVHEAKAESSERQHQHTPTKRIESKKSSLNAGLKRRVTESIDSREAQHDNLASTESTEMDETMLAETVGNKEHSKPKVAIKHKDVSTLHVVGKVKVEKGRLVEPRRTTHTPPGRA